MHKIAVFAAGLTCLFLPMAEAVPITSGFAEITATEDGFGLARLSVTGPGYSFTGRAEEAVWTRVLHSAYAHLGPPRSGCRNLE